MSCTKLQLLPYPRSLSLLCPQLNSLNPPPLKKIPGYATGWQAVADYVFKRSITQTVYTYTYMHITLYRQHKKRVH